tara:strand:- start:477 stop:695 length:219 start_codon:yes stop_codon:yes gene_type:complete
MVVSVRSLTVSAGMSTRISFLQGPKFSISMFTMALVFAETTLIVMSAHRFTLMGLASHQLAVSSPQKVSRVI